MSTKSKTHFFSWDERRDIAHPGNYLDTITFCAEHFVNCAKEAIKLHGFFSVALSGGSTPKAIYEALSKEPFSREIDWNNILLFWSDERSVPPFDKESNFQMAMQAGLKGLSIPSQQVFRMAADANIEENEKEYENKIRHILGSRPFDLIMLGMGEDGHTASLFPGTEALHEKEKWVVANYIPQKNTWRMTLTFPCINRAKNTVIYVFGKSKREMVKKVFLENQIPPYPVSLVGTPENKALWVLDTQAGELLFKARATDEKI